MATIYGTTTGGVVNGTSGNDLFVAEGGNDTFNGGGGFDGVSFQDATGAVTVDLGHGTATGFGSLVLNGITQIVGSYHGGTLTGDTNTSYILAAGGDTTVTTPSSAIVALAYGNDTFTGGGGNNTVYVIGNGNNHIDGGSGFVTLSYVAQTAPVYVDLYSGAWHGGIYDAISHITSIEGSATGTNVLKGDFNANIIKGGAAGDVIVSGGGADILTGGAGADTFVFGPGYGAPHIVDFTSSQGDKIDLSAFGTFHSLSDVMAATVDSGGNAVITAGNQQIAIDNVQKGSLTAQDFVFSPAPFVNIANQTLDPDGVVSVASLISYFDDNNQSATQYRFMSTSSASNAGYFSDNASSHEAANQAITIAASDLASVQLHAGSVGGTQTMSVQAYDGTTWGAWSSFTLTTTGSGPPSATIANQSLAAGASEGVSSLISYSDPGGHAATQYRFWDGGTDPSTQGYFTVGGAQQAEGQNITVAASDLGGVQLHAGSASGSQTMWVQAFDGTSWSQWASFTLNTSAAQTQAPTATISNQTLAAGASEGVSSLISYSGGHAATQYHFWANGTGSTDGYFSDNANSHEAGGQNITVAASDLGSVQLHAGSVAGSETMWVQAFDGTSWSQWSSFTLNTSAPQPPTATISNQSLAAGVSEGVSSLISYSDPGGHAATQYRFWDGGTNPSTQGYFTVGGAQQAEGQNITVAASDLGGVQLHAGSASGSQTMWVQAFDGTSWSQWASFTLDTSAPQPPTATIANQTLATGASEGVSSLISYSGGHAATQYHFWANGTGSTDGYFSDNANSHEAGGQNITVAASDLGSVQLHGGSVAGSETMWVQAFDGTSWSQWSSFTLNTSAPQPPTATISNQTLATGASEGVSSLISYTGSQAATQYHFWANGTGSTDGYFSDNANSHEAGGQNITVAASDLGSVQLHAGSVAGSETMWVQAFDGTSWSQWSSFTLDTSAPLPPTATIADQSLAAGASESVSSLINYTDPGGHAATQYHFWANGTGSTDGYFSDNANSHEAGGQNITVAASDLGSVQLHAGSVAGSETMWVQAFDGTSWSQWSSFTLNTSAPQPPTATIANQTLATGASEGVSGLISYSDPGGHAATQYQFWDSGTDPSTQGYFTVGGVQQGEGHNITVAASDIGSVQLHAGSVHGTQDMWVQAYDGVSWSAWHEFTLTS